MVFVAEEEGGRNSPERGRGEEVPTGSAEELPVARQAGGAGRRKRGTGGGEREEGEEAARG